MYFGIFLPFLEKSELSLENRMLQRSIALEIPMRFLTLTQAHDPP